MGGRPVCLLTTTGRRSGKPRTTPVMPFPHEDGMVIVASNGGSDRAPSWYGNLTAHPQVHVQTGGQVRTVQDDLVHMTLPAASADVVVAASVLHHLRSDAEWEGVFAKVYAALRPGGFGTGPHRRQGC